MSNYGFIDDEKSTFNFGLNANRTFLKKFEYTTNGGRDGAAQEALDIVFEINGSEKGYRQFPVTKAFDDKRNEVTDPNHPAMIEEQKRFGSVITHIVGCFVDKNTIKAAFSKPVSTFKEFCQIMASLLPEGFSTKPLDIFMQWQWNIRGEQPCTYLEIPKNMKQGKWLVPAQPHKGAWVERKMKDPTDKIKDALYYVDSEDENNIHPFVRTGWFMNSAYSHQQRDDDSGVATSVLKRTPAPDDELPFKEEGQEPVKKGWV